VGIIHRLDLVNHIINNNIITTTNTQKLFLPITTMTTRPVVPLNEIMTRLQELSKMTDEYAPCEQKTGAGLNVFGKTIIEIGDAKMETTVFIPELDKRGFSTPEKRSMFVHLPGDMLKRVRAIEQFWKGLILEKSKSPETALTMFDKDRPWTEEDLDRYWQSSIIEGSSAEYPHSWKTKITPLAGGRMEKYFLTPGKGDEPVWEQAPAGWEPPYLTTFPAALHVSVFLCIDKSDIRLSVNVDALMVNPARLGQTGVSRFTFSKRKRDETDDAAESERPAQRAAAIADSDDSDGEDDGTDAKNNNTGTGPPMSQAVKAENGAA
jgi:hypothetical protein